MQRTAAYYNINPFKYTKINLGFIWWKGDGEVYLYASHFVQKKTEAEFGRLEAVQLFSNNNNWNWCGDEKDIHAWEKTKPLSQILVEGGNQIKHISDWFSQRIDEWKTLKEQVPTFFELVKGSTEVLPEPNTAD